MPPVVVQHLIDSVSSLRATNPNHLSLITSLIGSSPNICLSSVFCCHINLSFTLAALGVLVRSMSLGILVNFGPLVRVAQSFDSSYLGYFVTGWQNLAWLGVWPIDAYCPNLVNYGLLFRDQKFSTAGMLHIFCQSATKYGSVRGIGA